MSKIFSVELTMEEYSTVKTALILELERQKTGDAETRRYLEEALNAINHMKRL